MPRHWTRVVDIFVSFRCLLFDMPVSYRDANLILHDLKGDTIPNSPITSALINLFLRWEGIILVLSRLD